MKSRRLQSIELHLLPLARSEAAYRIGEHQVRGCAAVRNFGPAERSLWVNNLTLPHRTHCMSASPQLAESIRAATATSGRCVPKAAVSRSQQDSALFDHLVGDEQEITWNFKIERSGGP